MVRYFASLLVLTVAACTPPAEPPDTATDAAQSDAAQEPRYCEPLDCGLVCDGGYAEDEDGCPVCACVRPQEP